MTNAINNFLNLSEQKKEQKEIKELSNTNNSFEEKLKDDLEYARNTIKELVSNNIETLKTLTMISNQSQDPRSYEALAKLSETINNSVKQLMYSHEVIAKREEKTEEPSQSITNNNLFVGSSAELLRLIKNETKNKIIDV